MFSFISIVAQTLPPVINSYQVQFGGGEKFFSFSALHRCFGSSNPVSQVACKLFNRKYHIRRGVKKVLPLACGVHTLVELLLSAAPREAQRKARSGRHDARSQSGGGRKATGLMSGS